MKKSFLIIAVIAVAAVGLDLNRLSAAHADALCSAKTTYQELRRERPTGPELKEEFHQSYPLTATGVVSIANINGEVRIGVWDGAGVKVDAVKRARDQESLSEVTIDVVNTADSVRIKTKYPEQNSSERRRGNSASVDYVLTIPRAARLDSAELVNGSLEIEGVQGDVHAACVNGSVTARGLGGEVKIQTVNGKVEAEVNRVDDSKGISLNSVNGSIVLVIPASASAQVRASTIHGGITNDFGLQVDNSEFVGHNLDGQIGSGGPRVRLNNVNGSISIKRAGGGM